MGKRIYEYSIAELKKKSRNYRIVFWVYVIMALIIGFITSLFSIPSLNNVMGMSGEYSFILLLLVLLSVNILFVVFLWFVSESSYYKMLQLNADMMIFLKGKLGE